jgi:HSP20 family protein
MPGEKNPETRLAKKQWEPAGSLFEWPMTSFGAPMMRRFFEDWDRYFGGFGRGFPSLFWRYPEHAAMEKVSWVPDVEIEQREGRLFIKAELPGLAKEDVKVEITDETLVLSGEKKHEKEVKEKGLYRTEFSYGSFYRTIPLPEGVEVDKAMASFTNGVLEISMPTRVAEATKGRKLDIVEVKAKTAA